jgi:hypothetical protein
MKQVYKNVFKLKSYFTCMGKKTLPQTEIAELNELEKACLSPDGTINEKALRSFGTMLTTLKNLGYDIPPRYFNSRQCYALREISSHLKEPAVATT